MHLERGVGRRKRLPHLTRKDLGLSGAGAFAWCAQYDLHSRGESPPWTVMTGTIRLGKGVRREAGSEES